MKILGLDPGLRHTGWGVILAEGSRLRFVAAGVLHTDAARELPERLVQIHDQLRAVIDLHRPETAAVEETFVNKNPNSTLKLGMARGVVLAVPALMGLAVAEYTANQVKKAVVGVGHADKIQVQMMINRLLPGSSAMSAGNADAADALAVAICHAHHSATNNVWGRALASGAVA